MSLKFLIFWITQQNCFITIWIISTILMTTTTEKTSGELIFRVDPLALLSATLRTYQKAVCDTDQVILTCPRGTSISIEVAQYSKQEGNDGISIDELCPLDDDATAAALLISSKSSKLVIPLINSEHGNSSTHNINSTINSSPNEVLPENCMWPNAFQYSLLQTVVEACQKKKHCKFNATPGTYGIGASGVGDSTGSSSYHHPNISPDPCPRVRKFVEIAYKCRPYEFRSKVACENDIVQLECNPYSRIAVYSASFGRTEYESIQCSQPQGVREETCLASYATETVMQICHGRRRCNLAADANTFGSPCHRNSRMYLKVVYTCVPKQVLKDRYESIAEPDEPEDFEGDVNDLYDDDQFYKESEAIPKLQSNMTRTSNSSISDSNNNNNNNNHSTSKINSGNSNSSSSSSSSSASGGSGSGSGNTNLSSTIEPISSSANPIMTHSQEMNLRDEQERLYFFLLLAGTGCFILCIIIVAVRLIIIQKKQNLAMSQEHSSSSPKGETTIPNGFNDSISEIDADIDLTVQIPVPSVSKNENYITYCPTSSLYGSLGPSNVSHTSSTMLLQPSTNSLMCARQSPDIIGVSNTFIGSGTQGQISHVTSGMGTIIPITSMAQYTTATGTSFHPENCGGGGGGGGGMVGGNYIIDHENSLRRPASTFIQQQIITPGSQSPQSKQQQQQQQQQQQHSVVVIPNCPQQETFHYDGTAPRTLSTGVAQNSQFYYG